jgi:hypothetical protein
MANLSSLYMKAETLKTLLEVVTLKGEKGVELTISNNDDMNDYDQNVSAFVAQSKEQREVKKPKFYVGNGRTFWSTNNDHPKPKPKSDISNAEGNNLEAKEDDLPF